MNTGVQNPSPLGGMGVVVELHVALGISSGDVAAFVGAGGKFSAILAVCGGLTQEGMKVLVAPTTKMLLGEADRVGPLVTSEDASGLRAKTERALSRATAVVVGSGIFSNLTGIGQGQSITPRAFALALSKGSLARVPRGQDRRAHNRRRTRSQYV